jgi:hypothetical protein
MDYEAERQFYEIRQRGADAVVAVACVAAVLIVWLWGAL